MNIISFDNYCNCTIRIPAESAKLSFLTNPLFINTAEHLKSDIKECYDSYLRPTLKRFLKDVEDCRFGFMHYEKTSPKAYIDIEENVRTINDNDIEILDDSRLNGNWMTFVHNIQAEHTGFWYAAINISREIRNIKDRIHILKGYLKFTNSVDEIIMLIKQSTSVESSFNELIKRGFSEQQANAILEYRLNFLHKLDRNRLTEDIDKYTELIEILKDYD